MDSKTQKRMFDPFYTTKPRGAETGLGVSVSYFIIATLGVSVSYFIIATHHQGKIAVDTKPGEGTTLTISLPFQERKTCTIDLTKGHERCIGQKHVQNV